MNKETFVKGITIIEKTFNREMNLIIGWECLKDLPDQAFNKAVISILKTTKESYPGTNLIAILREQTLEENKRIVQEQKAGIKQIEYKFPDETETREFISKLLDAIQLDAIQPANLPESSNNQGLS